MYKPVIKRVEIDDSHFYFVDDVFFPSVTRILNYAPTEFGLIEFWKNNTKEDSEKILEQAGNRGSALHHACGRLLMGEELKLLEEFRKPSDRKALVGFTNWCAEFQPWIEGIEMVVASGEYKYAGTLDIKCKIAGVDYIIDLKTSNSVHNTHFLQVLAYKQAYFEMTGIDCKPAILHLNPRTQKGWTFHQTMGSKAYEFSVNDFLNIYKTYLAYNSGKVEEPPEVNKFPEVLALTHNSNDRD